MALTREVITSKTLLANSFIGPSLKSQSLLIMGLLRAEPTCENTALFRDQAGQGRAGARPLSCSQRKGGEEVQKSLRNGLFLKRGKLLLAKDYRWALTLSEPSGGTSRVLAPGNALFSRNSMHQRD